MSIYLVAVFASHLEPVERHDDSDALEAVWPLVREVNLSIGIAPGSPSR
jgi:hypothetical protein